MYLCFTDHAKVFDCVDHKTSCGKFFKRWEYQTTWPNSWETCMHIKKHQLEPDMEQWTGSKLGKEYVKAVYCHPAYLTHMQNTSCEMRGWMKHKLESTLLEEISMTSGSWHLPYGGKWRGTKEPLDEDERWEWKTWLKISIQKTKIMASCSITSWQIDGETMEAVTDFILGAPKSVQMVTAAMTFKCACSLEEKLWPT